MPMPAMAAASGSGLMLMLEGNACGYRGSVPGADGAGSIASGGLLSSSLESPLPPVLLSCHSSSRASADTVSGIMVNRTVGHPYL